MFEPASAVPNTGAAFIYSGVWAALRLGQGMKHSGRAEEWNSAGFFMESRAELSMKSNYSPNRRRGKAAFSVAFLVTTPKGKNPTRLILFSG